MTTDIRDEVAAITGPLAALSLAWLGLLLGALIAGLWLDGRLG